MSNRDDKGRFIKGHKVNVGKQNALGHHSVLSLEIREKRSASMKGKTSNSKGKKWSQESREKFSLLFRDNNGHNWQGGIEQVNRKERGRIEFRLWREGIYSRDNWTCQKCRVRGYKLHPHHIRNFSQYPELRFVIDNGITFCKGCHLEFHKIYGWKNNTPEQVNKFIEDRSLWIAP